MEKEKFLEIESKYNELKSQLQQGIIDHDEVKARLKKLMLRDESGNYWMIGSNTGKWYIYDGNEWKEKVPYPPVNDDFSTTQQFSQEDSKAIFERNEDETEDDKVFKEESGDEEKIDLSEDREEVILTETSEDDEISENQVGEKAVNEIELNLDSSETVIRENVDIEKSLNNSLEIEKDENVSEEEEKLIEEEEDNHSELVNCIVCQSKIPSHSIFCSFCGANQKELGTKRKKSSDTLIISSINILSLIFFMGGLGLIAGVIFGASFGIFDIFGDFLQKFPQMLIETRGKIQGGLIFAAIGGLGGFVLLSLISLISGLIYNSISYLFGGIKIRTK